VKQWIKDAPSKATLWTKIQRRRHSKLLVVLEVYISPSWTYLSSKEDQRDPGSFAAGLTLGEPGSAPLWQTVVLEDSTDLSSKLGNTTVSKVLLNTNCSKKRSGLSPLTAYGWNLILGDSRKFSRRCRGRLLTF
jgi:hypothetical protein